jgi:formamidopyrimidine-DNA glycosylase
MPELPEVESVRLQLLSKIGGKKITKVKILHPKSVLHRGDFESKIVGKKIDYIDRVGKLMIFSFENEADLFLLCHLRMTGQFFYTKGTHITAGGHSLAPSDAKDLPNKHTRVSFTFADKSSLHFNDMRLFGYIQIATADEVSIARSKFGDEPISEDFDFPTFLTHLARRGTSIKAALLDQTLVAGLGNIYVDEALFAAKVRPDRKAGSLTKKEAVDVIQAGGKIMRHSIEVGGTTFQSFADTDGHAGNFTEYLKVFGKQNTPCPRCKKTQIQKTRVAGRGTHFCPGCQK